MITIKNKTTNTERTLTASQVAIEGAKLKVPFVTEPSLFPADYEIILNENTVINADGVGNERISVEFSALATLQSQEKYIKFEAISGNNTISTQRILAGTAMTTGVSSNRALQQSRDGVNWTAWNGSGLALNVGTPLYVRGRITANGTIELYTQFVFTNTNNTVRCTGDMRYMALNANWELPADNGRAVPFTRCYQQMFQDCISLIEAPALPATTLALCCYQYMFRNCTSLTKAPALPATTLAVQCYQYMFDGCTSLIEAPVLPATTILTYSCQYMFRNCTSLTKVPELPAIDVWDWGYQYMFDGCTSLTKAPALPATTIRGSSYSHMFQGCTSLTEVPDLLVTNLPTTTSSHCAFMFSGCTSLTKAPALPATTVASRCYQSMFQGCTSLTKAPALPAATLAGQCYQWMFDGCTSLTVAPDLPATTLRDRCYANMFQGCTGLTEVRIRASSGLSNTTAAVSNSTTNMLADTGDSSPDGILYCNQANALAMTNATDRWSRRNYADWVPPVG